MFSRIGIELDPDVGAALGLPGGDEGAADVAVADQAVAEGDAAAPGVALGRRDPRVGHRHHHGLPGRDLVVGRERRLVGQLLAHALAGGVHRLPVEPAVGPGEVDELEQAQLGVDPLGVEGPQRPGAVGVDDDHLARLELPDEGGPHDVEGRRLGGEHPPAVEPAQAQGPEAVGVADAHHVGVVHEHEGEGALQLGQHLAAGPVRGRARRCGRSTRGAHGDADQLGHQVAVVADGAGEHARPRPPACRCPPGCRCGRGRCRRRRRCGSRAGRCPRCWTRWWSSGRGRWPGGPGGAPACARRRRGRPGPCP